jgi:hypothetical protein
LKNKKRFENPAIVSIDELAIATDDDLFTAQKRLESERQIMIARGDDASPWEVELAYIKRELQIRSARSDAHRKFSSEDDSYQDESNLEMPDLDNLYYIRLCAQRDMLKEMRKTFVRSTKTERKGSAN